MSKSTNRKEQEYNTSSSLPGRGGQVESAVERGPRLDESLEEYTDREIEYLDKFKEITGDAMDDEELYEIIIRYNFDEDKIEKEVRRLMQVIEKRGEEYGWTKIEKGKSKIKIFNLKIFFYLKFF
jgi:regulatory protein YycI of two-component signal transduction system YycFG